MKTLLVQNDAPSDSERTATAPTRRHAGQEGRQRFEKRFNPMLSMLKEAFVEAVTAEIPPQPADVAHIVEANLRGVVPDAAHA
ncbi:hypothetical protein [Methylibium sp.]|uniref:hypothetical protein n=1 Tax=Methylibium sp. TaxID=2067992 RepID=UPI0017FB5D82|nr:hypothetical protein [Methylibium sp.]MBA3590213.1 hypothetical protein [Methylibium sp.]